MSTSAGIRRRTIAGDDPQTLAGVGEFGLIAELRAALPAGPRTLVGIGDDAAVLATPDGRVVATTDCLADLAAMGAVPSALLVALAAPADLPVSWARELAAGLAAECARVPGAAVIGGDTARAASVLLAVTGLGDLAGRAPVLRSGSAPGDVVAVAGPLGHAAAGLALLAAGRTEGPLVAAQRRPAPPYDAGPEAADLGATAMIDISDGLLADLGHVADASGVLIDLSRAALGPGDSLLAAASFVSSGRTGRGSPTPPDVIALNWVLSGGEDHSLAATFPPGVALPPRWTPIGKVHPGQADPDGRRLGVVIDAQPWQHAAGWDHFA
jgi:thiamine-monophosphate kinase